MKENRKQRPRVTGVWFAKDCPRCEGFKILYCTKDDCHGPCDHDKLCPRCKGYGLIPERAFVIMGIICISEYVRKFPQKQLCQQYIESLE